MNPSLPHYLLFCETDPPEKAGHWRFELWRADRSQRFEAMDVEPEVSGQRLELLTVIRALESLDEPAWVTLMNPSSGLRQGVLYGLDEWRANGWQWERFGEMTPIKDDDLWRRLDQALQFHQLDCRRWRIDTGHASPGGPVGPRERLARRGAACWNAPVEFAGLPSRWRDRVMSVTARLLAAWDRCILSRRRFAGLPGLARPG